MKKSTAGFTLIELLIVIAIIGILAAIAIPNLLGARTRANDTAAAGCAKQISTAQEIVFIDLHVYADDLSALNGATERMVNNCEEDWVNDASDFTAGWEVEHPNGSGIVYMVGPGGIIPPP